MDDVVLDGTDSATDDATGTSDEMMGPVMKTTEPVMTTEPMPVVSTVTDGGFGSP